MRLTFDKAFALARRKYGDRLGMFGYLRTKSGKPIYGKYFSFGLNKIITKEELLKQ